MRLILLSLLACFFLTGCGSERVVVYRYYDEPVYRPATVYVPAYSSYSYSSYSSTTYGYSSVGGGVAYGYYRHSCPPVVVARPVCRPVYQPPVCRPAPRPHVHVHVGR